MADIDDHDSHASSFDEADDQDWADWVDDEGVNGESIIKNGELQMAQGSSFQSTSSEKVVYHALFLDNQSGEKQLKAFKTPKEALDHSKSLGCDVPALIKRNNLDALQVIRLFNHLRRQTLKGESVNPQEVNQLHGDEKFLNDDEELKPVEGYANDGLLQIDFDDLDAEVEGLSGQSNSVQTEKQRIEALESQVYASRLAIQDLRQRLADRLGLDNLDEILSSEEEANTKSHKAKTGKGSKPAAMSGEDSYYFSSYASHDIHQTMISDKVRTLSYAKFILAPENAHLFRGKVVMDVGCGSGILSMFAARAGAKEVIAIDASAVATRAKENIRLNRLDGIITVHHGKVENLDEALLEYKGSVDVIVSEWMGYFLLYESMMPAVLYARDRYLRKETGLLAPSHTRMLLSAVANCEVIQERIEFWDEVYGFSMKAMKTGLVDEAWTEQLKPEQVVTSVETMLELPLQTISPHQPSFSAPFALRVKKDCTIQAFISWFDTWFTPDGKPVPEREIDSDDSDEEGEEDHWDGQIEAGKKLEGLPEVNSTCPGESEIRGLNLQKDSVVPKNSDSTSSKGLSVSFTTSPFGPETHWKQTLFVLKEPIEAKTDSILVGVLRSSPNEENTRELDVEIHYSLREPTQPAQARRKSVEARTVQLFAVR